GSLSGSRNESAIDCRSENLTPKSPAADSILSNVDLTFSCELMLAQNALPVALCTSISATALPSGRSCSRSLTSALGAAFVRGSPAMAERISAANVRQNNLFIMTPFRIRPQTAQIRSTLKVYQIRRPNGIGWLSDQKLASANFGCLESSLS